MVNGPFVVTPPFSNAVKELPRDRPLVGSPGGHFLDTAAFHATVLAITPHPMRNEVSAGEATPPVVAETDSGTASFHRFDPSSATLELEYHITGLQTPLADESERALAEGVAKTCDDEIEAMRDLLRKLGEELSAQLGDKGKTPVIRHDSQDHDTRTWTDSRTEFHVDPSAYQSQTELTGYEGAADAQLVRQTVEITIQHRETAIRRMYDQVLEDATAKRAEAAPTTEQTAS